MSVVTRFAPSPTGFLHIGGARTALFNWLYAKSKGGKFLLRIEDTDRKRSTDEAMTAIIDGMKWLGLDWDGEEVYQFSRSDHHKEIAKKLIDSGHAYYCYATKEELDAMREKAQEEKRGFKYNGAWRDRDASDAPSDVQPTVRLKAPLTGETIINDKVQGRVVIQNEQMDDMIILRSDGTPTYMLAVVVDDHDMGVTDIIRGDDHLTNSAKQILIYDALGWDIPNFTHIPLIHGNDGAKLSKRHGALGVEAYKDMGYLPEAMRNYLLRLGWSHGDDEIISTAQAQKWFNLDNIGKSPSRFDFKKLDNLNGHYIKESDNEYLVKNITPIIKQKLEIELNLEQSALLIKAMEGLKQRAKNLNELAESCEFYLKAPQEITPKAQKALNDDGLKILKDVADVIESLQNLNASSLEEKLREYSAKNEIGLGKIMSPVRAAITGSHASPSMFEAVEILGKAESLNRINKIL